MLGSGKKDWIGEQNRGMDEYRREEWTAVVSSRIKAWMVMPSPFRPHDHETRAHEGSGLARAAATGTLPRFPVLRPLNRI